MPDTVISMKLSPEELSLIKDEAKEFGLSVAQWSKIRLLYLSEFYFYLETVKNRMQDLNTGQKVTIKILLAVEWIEIPRTLKLALGKAVKKQVDANKVPGIIPTTSQPGDRNSQWYIKQGGES